MPQNHNRLVTTGAQAIRETFGSYRKRFDEVTLRARSRFETLDWQGIRADAAERLDLYKNEVDKIERSIRDLLQDRCEDKRIWANLKGSFAALVKARNDRELAETFFNSVTRRIFATIGIDPQIEFVETDIENLPGRAETKIYRRYRGGTSATALIGNILADCLLSDGFRNLENDARQVAAKIETRLHEIGCPAAIDYIDMAESIFYRGMGAYLVGRICCGSSVIPLAIALLNSADGISVDAVLLQEKDLSILFSFTRSYFHVDSASPGDLIGFLHTLLPQKRIAELYTAIGFNKHGKTVLYRELLGHLSECREDQFEISAGERGLVMIVFNMPDDDLVFKLIRDRFGRPKKVTHREVKEKYRLVFRHDRAGRLIDAQTFEHLKFDDCFFSPDLLAQLKSEAGQTVKTQEKDIIFSHVYVERRVTPLNIFLQTADGTAVRSAVIDFGAAIKDLAVSNIFPGDILLKNFGVTRHGRVVFYDYDELCPLLSCNFRRLPQSDHYEDELSSQPWFYIDENDVFPEEFRKFLGLPEHLLDIFLENHSDLLDVRFWHNAQKAIKAGKLPHIFPYAQNRRLKPEPGHR